MSLLIRGSQWWALKGAIIFLSFFLPGSRTLRPFGVIQHSESTDAMGGGCRRMVAFPEATSRTRGLAASEGHTEPCWKPTLFDYLGSERKGWGCQKEEREERGRKEEGNEEKERKGEKERRKETWPTSTRN